MQERYLVIDAGNTNTEVGLYCEKGLISSWRFSSDCSRTEDEYYVLLGNITEHRGIDIRDVTKGAIASVVPDLTRIFTELFDKYLTAEVHVITGETDLGLSFLTDDHSFVGADLLINAYSARNKYKTNVIVIDFGTATTVQLVGQDGIFYGTVIAPGVLTASANLFQKASLLSKVRLEAPTKILGTNTKDSLLSGIVKGHCLMVDAFVREIKKEYYHLEEFKVVATGGMSPLLSEFLTEVDIVDKTLTIDGLYSFCKESLPPVNLT